MVSEEIFPRGGMKMNAVGKIWCTKESRQCVPHANEGVARRA